MTDRVSSLIRRPLVVFTAGVLIAGAAPGCTSVLDPPSLRPAGPTGAAPTTTSSVSITPVTPDGLLTGPGVTDRTISLGLLADPTLDRGFAEGVRLWQRSVNAGGGLCGRTVELLANGADGIPVDPAAAYRDIGTSVLGLITLPVGSWTSSDADPLDLAASVAADQIPTVTPTGTSGQLGPNRPIVAGATDDILAVNGLEHLLLAGTLQPGDVVAALSDGSATTQNALRGARWWAQKNGLDLAVRDADADPDAWPPGTVVLAPADPDAVASLLTGAPAVSVLTLLDGFDPASWSVDAVTAANGRLFVATPTPAFGSDYPAAVAVSSLAAAVGATNPGPRTLDGYATGATWGRLIVQACADRSLTRAGVRAAAAAVGPAPSTSLFGSSDPGLVVTSAVPATRASSLSVADSTAPTGLRSLAGLESAPGIDDYPP